ncbi:MAG: hypothetical protein HY343_03065 [Lentisphaerae bacterium]|nr:hypothetical protein [Lentisphaerota bacterium]
MITRWSDLLLIPVGHPEGSIAVGVALLVRVVLVASYVWFVVAGFKTDWKWGVGNLLFPPAALAYFYLHPERGHRPGFLWLAGAMMFMISIMVFRQGKLKQPTASYLEPAERSPQRLVGPFGR